MIQDGYSKDHNIRICQLIMEKNLLRQCIIRHLFRMTQV